MDKIDIKKWADIRHQGWKNLLLGNGASIAIHNDFAYLTLHGVATAQMLLPNTIPLFEKLGTTDFERVLLACWYADQVNQALESTSSAISGAYDEVRKALIKAVRSVHPVRSDVVEKPRQVGKFASDFETVITLNYDVTFYWAMMVFNAERGSWFKDAFHHGGFEPDWEYLRPHRSTGGATLILYPHGNLALGRNFLGEEAKLTADMSFSADLLDAIAQQWSAKTYVPVFVSEGTSRQKMAAIRRSPYLAHVYQNVLKGLSNSLVVYGWSFGAADHHILDAIAQKAPGQMAVSVFRCQPYSDQQAFCHYVRQVVSRTMPDTDVTFFDSQSAGCWCNQEH